MLHVGIASVTHTGVDSHMICCPRLLNCSSQLRCSYRLNRRLISGLVQHWLYAQAEETSSPLATTHASLLLRTPAAACCALVCGVAAASSDGTGCHGGGVSPAVPHAGSGEGQHGLGLLSTHQNELHDSS